jgi:hypothetical protein
MSKEADFSAFFTKQGRHHLTLPDQTSELGSQTGSLQGGGGGGGGPPPPPNKKTTQKKI